MATKQSRKERDYPIDARTISEIVREERGRQSRFVDLTAGLRLPISRTMSSFKSAIKRREEYVRRASVLDEEAREEALRCLRQDYRWYSCLRGQPVSVIKYNHDLMTGLCNTAANRQYTKEMQAKMLGVLYVILQHEAKEPREETGGSSCCVIN